MTAMTSLARPAAVPLARIMSAIAGAVRARMRQLARAYRNRSNAAVLAKLDDRMLTDIGLTRSDVRAALAEPLWGEPSNVLRTRALERRLMQHRISLGLKDSEQPAPPLVPDEAYRRPAIGRAARFTV